MATKRAIHTEDSTGEAKTVARDEAETKVKATPKPKGWNWSAIFIMGMMGLPAIITLSITAWDYFFPQEAVLRAMRTKLDKCYQAAKPNEKVDLDKILKKYKGKEDILFHNLRNKYPKFSACH